MTSYETLASALQIGPLLDVATAIGAQDLLRVCLRVQGLLLHQDMTDSDATRERSSVSSQSYKEEDLHRLYKLLIIATKNGQTGVIESLLNEVERIKKSDRQTISARWSNTIPLPRYDRHEGSE